MTRAAIAGLLVATSLFSTESLAQTGAPSVPGFCLRPDKARECRSFLHSELFVGRGLSSTSPNWDHMGALSGGVMLNRGPTRASGVVAVFSNLDSRRPRVSAVEFRDRWWHGRRKASVEFGVGPTWTSRSVDDREVRMFGVSGGVHLSFNEFVGVQGRGMVQRGNDGKTRHAVFAGGQVSSLGIPVVVAAAGLLFLLVVNAVGD